MYILAFTFNSDGAESAIPVRTALMNGGHDRWLVSYRMRETGGTPFTKKGGGVTFCEGRSGISNRLDESPHKGRGN